MKIYSKKLKRKQLLITLLLFLAGLLLGFALGFLLVPEQEASPKIAMALNLL